MFWLTGILGVLLGAAPFVFEYSDNSAAMWTSIGVGAAVIVLSGLEVCEVSEHKWEFWVTVGLLTILAPSSLASAQWHGRRGRVLASARSSRLYQAMASLRKRRRVSPRHQREVTI